MDQIVSIEIFVHGIGHQRLSFDSEMVNSVKIYKCGKPLLEGTYTLFEKALIGSDILQDISDENLLAEMSRRFLQR